MNQKWTEWFPLWQRVAGPAGAGGKRGALAQQLLRISQWRLRSLKPVGLPRLDAHQAHPGGRRKKGEEIRKEGKVERKQIGG